MEAKKSSLVIPDDKNILKALSSERRQEILKEILQERYTTPQLAQKIGISPQGLSKHLKILKKADLIRTEELRKKRGKPTLVKPSQTCLDMILSPDLSSRFYVPFLSDTPDYRKTRELVEGYREAISKVKGKRLGKNEISEYLLLLSDYTWNQVDKLSEEKRERELLEIFGISAEKITYEIGSWISLKFEELREAMRNEKSIDPLSPPNWIQTYDPQNPIIIPPWQEWSWSLELPKKSNHAFTMGKAGRWLSEIHGVLKKSQEILLLYKFRAYNPQFNLKYENLKSELQDSGTPLAKYTINYVKKLSEEIPEPNETVFESWKQCYGKCVNTLIKQLAGCKKELKKWEEKRGGVHIPLRRKSFVIYYEEMKWLKERLEDQIFPGIEITENNFPFLKNYHNSINSRSQKGEERKRKGGE